MKAERSFEFYQISEKQKMEAAVVGLEGGKRNVGGIKGTP